MELPFPLARVFFEPGALEYPRGKELYSYFEQKGIPVMMTSSHNRVRGIPGATEREAFEEAKQTLVIGVRRGKTFQTCKPSAHYQLPLATGCPGSCRYCYLHTTLGRKPYLRAYINIDEILERAGRYIREREPELTLFEGAAVSDPLFVEPLTRGVSAAISYFAGSERGKFRLVTKMARVEPFLGLEHGGKTHFRFSINTPDVISRFEKGTASLEKRFEAAAGIAAAGYPVGFLLAPLFLEGHWKEDYGALLRLLCERIGSFDAMPVTFELITHRFTARARNNINAIFPDAGLDMDTERRRFRYGQFGYGKYVYTKDLFQEGSDFFRREIDALFPGAAVEYYV